jgi:hypothetical protein
MALVGVVIGVLGTLEVSDRSTSNEEENLTRQLDAQQAADEKDSRETAYAEFITAFSEAEEAYDAALASRPVSPLPADPSQRRVAIAELGPVAADALADFDEAVDEVNRTGTLVRMFGSEEMGARVDEALDEFATARCNMTDSCKSRDADDRAEIADLEGVLQRIVGQARVDLDVD